MTPGTPARLRRVAPLAVAAMTLAVVAGACGSSATPTPTPPPDPTAMLTKSATSLMTLKSFHLEVDLGGTIQNPDTSSGGPASITLDGTKLTADVDIAGQKGTVALVVPPALLTTIMAASGGALPGASAPPSGDTVDVIYAGDLYVKVPLLASMVGGDKWIKISAASLQGLGDQFASGFASGFGGPIPSFSAALPSASPDLTAINNLLTSTGITVASQGTDSCAGDGTCNKTVITVPASAIKQLAALGAASGGAVSSAVPDLSSIGTTTVTIWTGASNDRFNKLSFSASAGSAGNITFSIALSNFDQPVNASAPPADQVTTFPGL